MECPICFSDLEAPFVTPWVALPCRHVVGCAACVVRWIEKHPTCPLCRRSISFVRSLFTHEFDEDGDGSRLSRWNKRTGFDLPIPAAFWADVRQDPQAIRRWFSEDDFCNSSLGSFLIRHNPRWIEWVPAFVLRQDDVDRALNAGMPWTKVPRKFWETRFEMCHNRAPWHVERLLDLGVPHGRIPEREWTRALKLKETKIDRVQRRVIFTERRRVISALYLHFAQRPLEIGVRWTHVMPEAWEALAVVLMRRRGELMA